MNDTAQITRDIVRLAEMTAKTGTIYDLQRENLKNYGIVAFGRQWEVYVDLENCLVTYTLKKQLFGKPEVLGRTIGHLEKAVRNLFETPATPNWRLAVEDTTGVLYVSGQK